MKHVYALVIKFVMTAVILEIMLSVLTNLTFSKILVISLTVTIAAYIVGDLFILAISNNTIATIADAGLAWLVIYLFNYVYTTGRISVMNALFAGVVLAVGEWFFHKYMARSVFPKHEHV